MISDKAQGFNLSHHLNLFFSSPRRDVWWEITSKAENQFLGLRSVVEDFEIMFYTSLRTSALQRHVQIHSFPRGRWMPNFRCIVQFYLTWLKTLLVPWFFSLFCFLYWWYLLSVNRILSWSLKRETPMTSSSMRHSLNSFTGSQTEECLRFINCTA